MNLNTISFLPTSPSPLLLFDSIFCIKWNLDLIKFYVKIQIYFNSPFKLSTFLCLVYEFYIQMLITKLTTLHMNDIMCYVYNTNGVFCFPKYFQINWPFNFLDIRVGIAIIIFLRGSGRKFSILKTQN
jgi:hypothetical protein